MVLLKHHKTSEQNNNCFPLLTQAMNWLCTVLQWKTQNKSLYGKEVNMTSNQIAYFKAKIEEAHYGRADAETARSNRANEALTAWRNEIDNAHYLRSDAENVRSNMAREQENYRSDLAREQENYRSNRAKEEIEWAQIPSKNAERWSNVSKNYADTSLKNAQTQTEYAKRDLTQSQTNLTNQQAATEWWNTQNKQQDTWLKEAQRENVETETYWADMYAMSSVLSGFGNFFKGASSVFTSASALEGGKNNGTVQQNNQIKRTDRWWKDGHTYETTWYEQAQ